MSYNRQIKARCMVGEPGRRAERIVFAMSGNRCAMPDCRKPLVVDGTDSGDPRTMVGELAHIAGLRPGSARYDETMSDKERNSDDNLIAVCPSCHKRIDDQPLEHTAEKLRRIKSDRGALVRTALDENMNDLTFPELHEVISRMIAVGAKLGWPSTIEPALPLREKIVRNRLSPWTGGMISAGLARVKLVADCINESDNATLANRLNAGMALKYEQLRSEGLDGDDLFFAMWRLAGDGNTDMKKTAAGLAVLVYFFEACEVFES